MYVTDWLIQFVLPILKSGKTTDKLYCLFAITLLSRFFTGEGTLMYSVHGLQYICSTEDRGQKVEQWHWLAPFQARWRIGAGIIVLYSDRSLKRLALCMVSCNTIMNKIYVSALTVSYMYYMWKPHGLPVYVSRILTYLCSVITLLK